MLKSCHLATESITAHKGITLPISFSLLIQEKSSEDLFLQQRIARKLKKTI